MNDRALDRPAPKKEPGESSLERILESALELIVSRGFTATSVDDIAHNAGLTKGAIYFHFKNKTAILMSLLDDIERLIIGGMTERVIGAGPTATDKLVAAIHNQGKLAESKTKYLLLFTLTLLEFNGTDTTIEARVRSIYSSYLAALEQIIRTGKQAGEFHLDVEPRELAAVVMALEHGTLMEWYCRSALLNGPELVRAARHVLLHGLLRPPQK